MKNYTQIFKQAFEGALNVDQELKMEEFCQTIMRSFFIQCGLDTEAATLASAVWASAARRQYSDQGARMPAAVLKVMVDRDVDAKVLIADMAANYDSKLLLPFKVESKVVKKLK